MLLRQRNKDLEHVNLDLNNINQTKLCQFCLLKKNKKPMTPSNHVAASNKDIL